MSDEEAIDGPALKRKRVSGPKFSTSGGDSEDGDATVLEFPERDREYYMDRDGADCVFLVANTLFKVHRFVLSKDSSVFSDMFSLPTKRTEPDAPLPEGSSDGNPIILHEDVEQFRALLWVLYALPRDLQKHQGPAGDLMLLIKISMITHRYHFASTEAWALDAICGIVSDPAHTQGEWYDSNMLTVMLEVAMLSNHDRLQSILVENWTPRILDGKLPPIPAIKVADKYQIPALQGAAYFAYVLEMDRANLSYASLADMQLGRDQLVRLLSGHWSLVKSWEHCRAYPVHFPKFDGCTYHNGGCLSAWHVRWNKFGRSEKMMRLPAVSILAKLNYLHEQLSGDEQLASAMTPECKVAALTRLRDFAGVIRAKLVDHFVDRTQPLPPGDDDESD